MAEDKPHILIVDDDDRLRALLKRFLSGEQYMVTAAADAAEARRLIKWFTFDVMVLDIMMPGEDGLSLLKSIARERRLPVLMLSAMGDAKDRIKGLEIGAEDYLPKPFEPAELLLRIKTILRRQPPPHNTATAIAFGDCRFEPAASRLICKGEDISLTSSEAALLMLLAQSPGSPMSRGALAAAMPGSGSERSVDVQVTRLRKKIGEPEGKPLHLKTVRGAGYVLYGKPA